MIDRAISQSYAKVLFNLDQNKDTLKQRLLDFESMVQIFKNHPKLAKFINLPQVAMFDKKKVFDDCLKGKFDSTFMNFLFYLLQQGRLVYLSQIAKEYRLIVNKHLEIWEADIVTAVPMDIDSEVQLKKKLERDFHKKIHLNQKVDPKIIGGAILVMANEMLDWSVTGRLKKLKKEV